MKPSQTNRCARTIVRDFLVGLALFLTVFTLAMLDSRASHSAPAFFAKPLTVAHSEAFIPVKISMGTLGIRISENGDTDFETSNSTMPLPGAKRVGKDFPATFPAVKKNTALPGSGSEDEAAGQKSKLAMTLSKRKAERVTSYGIAGTDDRTWVLGVMAFIFAAMTALTLGLWRHLRLTVAPRRGGRRV